MHTEHMESVLAASRDDVSNITAAIDSAGDSWNPHNLCDMAKFLLRDGLEEYPAALTERKGVCGKTWDNSLAVKCTTCQADANCALCVECFDETLHVGHDWRMIQSGGGMCDCGDATAWDPKGFCKQHRGIKEDEDPRDGVPLEVSCRATCVVAGLMSVLKRSCMCAVSDDATLFDKAGGAVKVIVVVSKCLTFIASLGSATARIVAELLCEGMLTKDHEDSPHFWLMKIAFSNYDKLGSKFPSIMKDFYMTLMPDFHMRKMFALGYSRNLQQAHGYSGSWCEALSVQFLTVPSIVNQFQKPDPSILSPGLFHSISQGIIVYLKELLRGIDGYQGIRFEVEGLQTSEKLSLSSDRSSSNAMSKCWQLICDFVMCLRSDIKHSWYCCNEKIILDRFLYHMLVLQQSLSCHRVDADMFEPTCIRHELKCCSVSERLAEGVVLVPDVSDVKKLTGEVVRFLDAFLSNALLHRPIEAGLPWLHENNIYECKEHGVFFQLPLHRFMTNIVHRVVQQQPTLDVKEYLPEDFVKNCHNYMEPIITVKLATAQVLAGMWRRNHMGIEYQADWYSIPNFQPYFLIPDLFFLQLGTVLGPTAMAVHLAHRFSAHQPLLPPDEEAREYEVLGSFLRLVLVLATDRTRSAPRPQEKKWLYYRVIHTLAQGPKKFSELVQAHSSEEEEDEPTNLLEALLKECASSVDGIEGRQFTLKKECWTDVNPYEIGWAETTTTKADAEFAKIKSGRTFVPLQKPVPTFPSISPILGILHNEVTLSIAVAAISCMNENIVRKSLDIILLALRTRDEYKAAWSIAAKPEQRFYACKRTMDGVDVLIPKVLQWENNGEPPNVPKLLTTPCNEMMPLEHVLKVLKAPNLKDLHPAARDIISEMRGCDEEFVKLIDELSETLPNGGGACEIKARKAKGKAKQKAMLSKMQQQHAALEFQFSDDENEDASEEGEVRESLHRDLDFGWMEDSTCCLCNMVESPHNNTDIGLVALTSKGNALSKCFSAVNDSPPSKKQRYEEEGDQGNEFCSPMNGDKGHTIVHTCGHFVHFDCLDSHIKHIRHSADIAVLLNRDTFKGIDVLDLRLSEYLCPLCSRICNTLCPIIGTQEGNKTSKLQRWEKFPSLLTQKPAEEDLSRDEGELEELFNEISSDVELCGEERRLPHDDAAFIHRIETFKKNLCEAQFKKDKAVRTGSPMVLWAQQVAITEIAGRFEAADTVIPMKKLASLRCQLKALLTVQQYEVTSQRAFRSLLHIASDEEPDVQPLLASDVFGIWVQTTINVSLRNEDIKHAGHRFLLRRAVEAQLVALILRLLAAGYEIENKVISVIVLSLASYLPRGQKKKKPDFDVILYLAKEMSVFLSWMVIADYAITAPLAAENLILPSYDKPEESMKIVASLLLDERYGSVEGIAKILVSREGDLGTLDGWASCLEHRQVGIPAPYFSHLLPRLIDLPSDYVALINKYHNATGKCGNVPSKPVLCLSCGELVCASGKCCSRGSDGPGTAHARQCGMGQSLFLEIKSTKLIAVDIPRKCVIPSVYTDSYGEDDPDLERGRPLFLNQARLDRITRIASLGMYGFDTSIIETTTVNKSGEFSDF